jgi:DNA mismatch repair ATPase MutL
LDIKYDADDRLYTKIEDGEYDPKTAAKRLNKRSEKEEKETADVLKDKIENLTREQKEQIVREYIRRKINKVLAEQATPPTDEEQPTEEPEATPTEPEAPEATDTTATPTATPAAAPDMTATPTPAADPTAATPTEEPATAETTPEPEVDPETKKTMDTDRFVQSLKMMPGTVEKIKAIANVIKLATNELEYDDSKNFFQLLRTYAINKLERLGSEKESKK